MKSNTPDSKTFFTNQELNTLKRIVEDTIKITVMSRSYFKLSQIIKGASDKAKKESVFTNKNKISHVNDVITEIVMNLASDNSILINIERDQTKTTGNYTTTELLLSEKKCVQLSSYKSDTYSVDPIIVEKQLAEMPLISEEQREAVYHVCYSDKMVSIYQGLAGAGKSFTSKAIKTSYQDRNFDIKGIALSWNAAGVLAASANIDDCQAIEAFCRSYSKASQQKTCMFEKDTLIIVDEAGLVGTNHMVQILEAAYDAIKNHGRIIKIVLTGDALQLLPVNAGGMFKTLERQLKSSTIGTIRRQVQESQRKMVRYASERRSGNALYTMIQQENIAWGKNHETTINFLIQDFLSYKVANPNKSALILALKNEHVIEINNKVREAYKKLGFLRGEEIEITVSDGRGKSWRSFFAAGDEIVIRTNYRDTPVYHIPDDETDFDIKNYKQKRVGVFNRNNGKVVKIKESQNPIGSWDIYVDMSGDLEGRMVINTEKHLDGNVLPIHHNYATTIYASQGQTVKQTFLLYDPKIDFRLFYVGISRHTDNCTFYLNENLLHKQLDADKGMKIQEVDENGQEIMTELGRYSRTEMLKGVAKNCGKDKQNETSLDYIYKISNPEEKKPNERDLFEIKPANYEDNLMDFDDNYIVIDNDIASSQENINKFWQNLYFTQKTVFCADENKIERFRKDAEEMNESFLKYKKEVLKINNLPEDYQIEEGDHIYYKEKVSVRYKKINLQKLLQEDGSNYTRSIVIPEKEVDQNKFKRGIDGFMPILKEEDIIEEESFGENISLLGLINEVEEYGKMESEPLEVKEERSLNKVAKTSQKLFKGLLGNQEIQLEKKEEIKEEEKKNEIDLNPKLEFIEEKEPIIDINIKGNLYFTDEKYKLGDEGFLEWVNESAKGEIWEKGKYHEPRFLALDANGLVRDRYNQFGESLLGTGYPAMLTNPNANNETPVWVVPGVVEWMWSYYFYMRKSYANFDMRNFDNLEDFINSLSEEEKKVLIQTPEFIWGTESTDYGEVKEYLEGRVLTIVRGKDPKNEEWALNLRKYLWETWYMKSEIKPPFPNNDGIYEEPWKNATEEELRIAAGDFKEGDLVREVAKIKSH